MDSKDTPLVSIIMPAYNANRFIGEAIASVQAQTYPNWELIIVDDGSTDNTVAVVQQYHDPRICLHRLKHSGYPSRVKNQGIRLSRGQYLAFLDADDQYLPDALERLLSHLLDNPTCIGVHGFDRYIDEQGNPLTIQGHSFYTIDQNGDFILDSGYEHTWYKFLYGFGYYHIPAMMLPRKTIDAVGLLDESLYIAEDRNYFLRLFEYDLNNFHFIKRPIFLYRRYGTSVTKDAKRFVTILKNIPVAAAANHKIISRNTSFKIEKSDLAAKQYRFYLSIRLTAKDYTSGFKVIFFAMQNRDLKKAELAKMILLELLYHFCPGFIKLLKKIKAQIAKNESGNKPLAEVGT